MNRAGSTSTIRRRHPLAPVVVLLLALVAVGAVYAALAGMAGGRAEAAAQTATPQQIEQGKQLYLQGCSSCHGLAAQGSNNGPTLVGVGAAAVDFQVGTGRMPAAVLQGQIQQTKVNYTQEQIDAMAAFVASLGPGPAIPGAEQLDLQGADLSLGGALFRTNCAQCHNFAGSGGALTEGKYAPSLANVSDKHIYEAMLTGPQSMPVFADTTLAPKDKQAIIAYIGAVRDLPNPGGAGLGRIGPVPEGLLIWVLGLGAVTAVAVWIGARAR